MMFNKTRSRYSEDLKSDVHVPSSMSIVEEVKDSYSGLLDSQGRPLVRIKPEMGFAIGDKRRVT